MEPEPTPSEHSFALCLTHDVDRPYKTYQSVYYAVSQRRPGHLLDLLPGHNRYWQFHRIADIEQRLGVRSSFNFLDEQRLFRDRPPREWVTATGWQLFTGRYSLSDPAIARVIHALDDGGWEVGLHGSYHSYSDPERLRAEKASVESVLGRSVLGGRQHHLNLEVPATWRYQAEAGLRYDTTIGSSTTYGFDQGYQPFRPLDHDQGFVVFPLTLMEQTLPAVETDPERAWAACESLLEEAEANDAVMTVLWHPCYFSDYDRPNYADIYRRLIERALEMGAWVGPPGAYYRSMPDTPDVTDTADQPRTRAAVTGERAAGDGGEPS
jgi:peptidoglycan/xylan/chitin deacetylase (PgdA/CDA1 family)